jgi:hypothetical protein
MDPTINPWFKRDFRFLDSIKPLFDKLEINYIPYTSYDDDEILICTKSLIKVFANNDIDSIDEICNHVKKYYFMSSINYYYSFAGYYSNMQTVLYFDKWNIDWKYFGNCKDYLEYESGFHIVAARPDDDPEIIAEIHNRIIQKCGSYNMINVIISAFSSGNIRIFKYLCGEYLKMNPERNCFLPKKILFKSNSIMFEAAINVGLVNDNDIYDALIDYSLKIPKNILKTIRQKVKSRNIIWTDKQMVMIRERLGGKLIN